MLPFFPFSTNISDFKINIIHRKLVFCNRKTFVVSGLKHFLFLRMTPTVLFLTRMMSSSIGRYPGTFILSILSRKLKRRKNVIAINKSLFSRVSNSTITNVCLFVHLSVQQQNPSTAWNHHPSSFIIHPSSFFIHFSSSFIILPSSFIPPSSFFIHPSFISQLLSFSACCLLITLLNGSVYICLNVSTLRGMLSV